MKVLQIGKFYPPHRGGMESHLETLCQALHGRVEISVLVASEGKDTVEGDKDGIFVSRLGTKYTVSGASVCPSMVKRIRQTAADVVHIHLPNPTALIAFMLSGHRGRLVVTYHSDIVRQKLLAKGFEPVLKAALKKCDALICSSQNYIESSPTLSAFRHLCKVIPFGIPTKNYDQVDVSAICEIRRQHGPRVVLALGRLVYYKGFQHLIKAMSSVDAKLLIIGEGPLRAYLQQMIDALNLAGRVDLLGDRENVAPYYHAADLFVLPAIARSEAFGIVQLEAMACRKPVINTRIASGVPFVSMHGVTGLTVNPSDPDELARAITLLLEDPTLRAQYGLAARKRVEHEFCLEVMAQRTLNVYEQVLGREPSFEVAKAFSACNNL